jgi:glycosyltransferase involved in cell wall biosynthesis
MRNHEMKNKILLFIPIYNCENQIIRVINKLNKDVLSRFSEVLVVNNRSSDNSEAAAVNALKKVRGCKVTLLRNLNNYGLGGSHKVAFSYALNNGYGYCAVLHGDDQGNIYDILPSLDSGEHKKFDCLLNSRFMPNSSRVGYSKLRIFGNLCFNFLFSIASKKVQWDLGSGLCCYSKKFLEAKVVEMCSDDLTFNYTLQLYAASKKIKQKFFPSRWVEDDQISNVKLFKQTWKMIKILFLFIFRKKYFLTHSFADPNFTYKAKIIYQSNKVI